ncbi:hypothetical protein AYI69_g3280 [Smittium culicis]|uniref:Uncharacterized protein n=1 Tax=Smittium culicis TaxID=133412 RepID=A0A1R1YK37_9FUNG|nr:hypothetical protein AYI69_g3280 [Smittium culicis]
MCTYSSNNQIACAFSNGLANKYAALTNYLPSITTFAHSDRVAERPNNKGPYFIATIYKQPPNSSLI